jgi:hypothetical protein
VLHERQLFGGLGGLFGGGNDNGNGNSNNGPATPPEPTANGNGPNVLHSTVVVVKTMTVVGGGGGGNSGGGDSSDSSNNSQQQTTQIQSDDNSSPSSSVDSIETDSSSAFSTDFTPFTTTSSSAAPESIVSTSSVSLPSTLAVATNTPPAETLAATSAASASPSGTGSSSSSGPSAGAKAGIAIGVLAGVLGLFVLALFIYNKRRRQLEARADDEKPENPFADPVGPSVTAAAVGGGGGVVVGGDRHPPGRAPRLSLRPVTQFMPNIGRAQPQHPDRRQSRGAMIPMVQNPQSPYRPGTAGQDRANPFGNHAAISGPMTEDQLRSRSVSPVTPIEGNRNVPPPSPIDSKPLPEISDTAFAAGAAGAAAGAAASGLTRKTSIRKDGPAALDLTLPPKLSAIPPSPSGTEFSFHEMPADQQPAPSSGAAAIAAAGGPAASTVHRVQLDFKPTLEDEMELHAGQLVRLLHEYDDGWVRLPVLPTSDDRTTMTDDVPGSLHPPRPLEAGRRPAHLPLHAPRQAKVTDQRRSPRSSREPAARSRATARPARSTRARRPGWSTSRSRRSPARPRSQRRLPPSRIPARHAPRLVARPRSAAPVARRYAPPRVARRRPDESRPRPTLSAAAAARQAAEPGRDSIAKSGAGRAAEDEPQPQRESEWAGARARPQAGPRRAACWAGGAQACSGTGVLKRACVVGWWTLQRA